MGPHARRTALAALLLLSLQGPGAWAQDPCPAASPAGAQTALAGLTKECELTLGPGSLWAVRLVSALTPSGRRSQALLSEVDRVHVSVYDRQALPQDDQFDPLVLLRTLPGEGEWQVMVKAREDGERVWVVYRQCGDAISDLCVVGLEQGGLVVAQLEGNTERLLADAALLPLHLYRGLARAARYPARGPSPVVCGASTAAEEEPLLRYNRVDGLYLGVQKTPAPHTGASAYGQLGYALGPGQWRYQVGAEAYTPAWRSSRLPSWVPAHRFSVGMEDHRLTDTQDEWLISFPENSAAALLLGEDLQDYYAREGWSAYAGYHLGTALTVRARVGQDEFWSLDNGTGWHLLQSGPGRPRFRPNPPIDEGWIHSGRTEVELDTRRQGHGPQRGWRASLLAERAGGVFGGDRWFQRYVADVRRYQPFSPGVQMDLRLRAATAAGDLPDQYLYHVGGFSTLRGYGYKEFTGDRMVLVNAEFWGEDFGAFVDAGAAWLTDRTALSPQAPGAARPLGEARLRSSIGWAVRLDQARLYLARPLQGHHRGWSPSVRFSRTF